MNKLDRLDIEILKRLQENSRYKYTRMAKELGVSEATIRARIKSLIERGYIEKFTIVVDPSKLGYGVMARIGIDVDVNSIYSVLKELGDLEEVYLAALSTGTHDILLDVIVKDLDDLKRFLTDKLGKVKGIKNYDVSIIMEIYKRKLAYLVFPPAHQSNEK
ncbi:MAG TPA: Lrp/AsnC family transcriptional regulator [Thermoprotei archaeon]|nr:Lrp/AsnC family transcriptional regulator [Thermoprotei archaeon]